ncbi:MAG: hypothetical protein HY752_03380 [Nitrospirae bacterium]|nr:hypothetical protein [Nitrospirota bacterium]
MGRLMRGVRYVKIKIMTATMQLVQVVRRAMIVMTTPQMFIQGQKRNVTERIMIVTGKLMTSVQDSRCHYINNVLLHGEQIFMTIPHQLYVKKAVL